MPIEAVHEVQMATSDPLGQVLDLVEQLSAEQRDQVLAVLDSGSGGRKRERG
jgi:hypothetical protein